MHNEWSIERNKYIKTKCLTHVQMLPSIECLKFYNPSSMKFYLWFSSYNSLIFCYCKSSVEEHIYIFFINYMSKTDFLLAAVIINVTRKVCDMKSLCRVNIKIQHLNKSAYINFYLVIMDSICQSSKWNIMYPKHNQVGKKSTKFQNITSVQNVWPSKIQ